ncbi:MAG TPA: ATP-binding cassette domain-containing protein [Candidatus Omnitrophica bacterium]|nr:ATP-binding cassette domain-containing protein [Candidatus Omnitrophota bacterium]
MRLYLLCLRYLKPYSWIVFLAIICMILYAAFNALALKMLKPVIDEGILGGILGKEIVYFEIPLINRVLEFKPLSLLKVLAASIIGVYALKGLCYYGQSYLTAYAGNRAIIDLRNNFYEHIHSQSLAFFISKKTGKIISRITNDVGLIKDALTVIFSDIIREPLTIVFVLILLFSLNRQLTLLALVVFPVSLLLLTRFGGKMRRVSYARQKRRADVLGVIQESIQGASVIKAFGTESYEMSKFAKVQDDAFRMDMKRARILALSSPVMELVGAIGVGVLLFVGGRQVIKGQFTIGGFSTFIVALGSLYRPVKKLARVNNEIQTSLAGAQRVFEVLDTPPEIRDLPDAVDLPPFEREIIFHNVSFSYNHISVLKDVNLKVKKGETVAIVGLSGVGKTTLVNLIPRFYDPTKGKIEIDGYDIKKVKLDSLRRQISIVSQETFLFNDTVNANITYGYDGNVPREKVVEVARAASAHEFIEKLSHGYNTIVGERGSQLSGGQKQRIAIARALLKNPSILILDEATSELDSEAESIVQRAMERLMKGRTTFIIAHRLSTVIGADKIVVLDKGRIVEVGTHEELSTKEGTYKRLYEMQFKENT